MMLSPITAIAEVDENGFRILSPTVGSWHVDIHPGRPVMGGDRIGRLHILNRQHLLILPAEVGGRIFLPEPLDHVVPVAYRQELCRVISLNMENVQVAVSPEAPENETVSHVDGLLLKAFTTGIFYRKSSPDAPPYVEEGQAIEPGKVLGLIEVMKSFNQIVFTGGESVSHGIVARIFVADGQEVKLGQPLFLIHDQ